MNRMLFTVFVFLFVSLISCSSEKAVQFKISPASFDFGPVNISESATIDFEITNKKSSDISLTVVSFSTGEFTETTNAQGKLVAAKDTLIITVRFTPGLPAGVKNDKLHIEWTDINGKTGKKDVSLVGEAVPVPIINTVSDLDFGTCGIGSCDSLDLSVENVGTADLVISNLDFAGNASLFSISAGGLIPVTIVPGTTHIITIEFAPIATGNFPTKLEVSHNAINSVTPLEVNITAAGGGGQISINQTSPWNFGDVRQSSSKTEIAEISNTGSIDLNISNIGLATGTVFTIEKIENSTGNPITIPFAISPGELVELSIKFTPTSLSTFNDTLSISHDGTHVASPVDIALTGKGVGTLVWLNECQLHDRPAGYGDWVEICNYGSSPVDVSNWQLTAYHNGILEGTFTFAPGSVLQANGYCVIDDNTSSPGWPHVYSGFNFFWSGVVGRNHEVILYDDTHTAIDYVNFGNLGVQPNPLNRPSNIPWTGTLNATNYGVARTSGAANTFSASDWVGHNGDGTPLAPN